VQLLIPHQLGPRISVRTPIREELQRYYPRSRPWTGIGAATTPARGKIHRDGRLITDTLRHATTHNLVPCSATVNRLPLVYKRRRRPLARGRRIAHSPAFPPSLTILALCLNHTSGTWRLLLLSLLACSPPLRAPWCFAIYRHERTPAGRTAHGRNQDKPHVPVLLSAGHRETDLSASTS
jgi:hypothetical protein